MYCLDLRVQRLKTLICKKAQVQKVSEEYVANGMLSTVPASRFGEAEEVANAIAFYALPPPLTSTELTYLLMVDVQDTLNNNYMKKIFNYIDGNLQEALSKKIIENESCEWQGIFSYCR